MVRLTFARPHYTVGLAQWPHVSPLSESLSCLPPTSLIPPGHALSLLESAFATHRNDLGQVLWPQIVHCQMELLCEVKEEND